MSIPDRLWRLARGRWLMANDALSDLDTRLAEAAAYEELADTLRSSPAIPAVKGPGERPVLPPPPAPRAGGHDPLEACYALLEVQPGASVEALETAYEARLAELRPEDHPAVSPARTVLEGRRSAVTAAYEKLRDALNTTETRFERLEF